MKNKFFFNLLCFAILASLGLLFTGCPPSGQDPMAMNGAFFMLKAAEQDKADTEVERDDCLYQNPNNAAACDSLVDRLGDLGTILTDLASIQGNMPSADLEPDPDVPDPCLPGNCIIEISVLQSLFFDISLAPISVELFDANGQTIGTSFPNDQPATQALVDNGAFVHTTLNVTHANYQGNGLLRITSGQEVFDLPVNLLP
jgi:hypothetical protein